MSLDNQRNLLVHPNPDDKKRLGRYGAGEMPVPANPTFQKRWDRYRADELTHLGGSVDNHRTLAHRENIQTRTGLIPKSFNNIPGFTQFAYNTVATAWLHSVGSEKYLDTLEQDLTETVLSNDVDHKFSPAAIANATMAIMADKEKVTQHFMKVAPHGPEVESMYPIKLTDLRATWEVEYVN